MGHTRWATHGEVSITNAHPHYFNGIAVIHNGIVENAGKLKDYLEQNGEEFTTQTDTEVILKLIHLYFKKFPIIDVLQKVVNEIEGSFAVTIMIESQPDTLYTIKRNSSLVFIQTDELSIVASDVNAVSPFSDRIIHFEDNDIGIISENNYIIYNNGKEVTRAFSKLENYHTEVCNNDESTFMLQEILQQPDVISNILENFDFKNVKQNINIGKFSYINIIGCGSSYFAGCVAKQWIEKYLNIRVNTEIASEFKYKSFHENELFIFISQSGETADTLSALKNIKNKGLSNNYIASLVNVPGSTISRNSDFTIYTNAGRENSVAATKTFTSQIVTFLCLILTQLKNPNYFFDELSKIKNKIKSVINISQEKLTKIVEEIAEAKNVLYLGKGLGYILAKEGALKLKEISYIHAESLPSGELKHGTIALIDQNLPVIVIAPHDDSFNKIFSNIQEVYARGGNLIIFTDKIGKEKLSGIDVKILELPETSDLTMPVVYTPALQLLAYYVALKKGNDIDHPRNLAKSVTVE
jgi:glucosamine--fructose-6-phosphate aminotransferase (isomerizing)